MTAAPLERRVVTHDGLGLRAYEWGPPQRWVGVVIAPGFSEYAMRYAELAAWLAARRAAAFAYDPRGHGESEGARGHAPRWPALVDDLGRVIDELGRAGALPARWALLGSSMGALVALDWARAHPERMHALALVAPFFRYGQRAPAWRVALARTAAAVAPTLAQPHGLRGHQLTSDPEMASGYDRDPWINRVMTARYYVEFRAAQDRLRAAPVPGRFPVLVLHGADDPIADPAPSAAWVGTLPSQRVESHVFPGMRHELLHERGRERVYERIGEWMLRALRPGLPIPG
jgi:alpha-beta hydrolase superfamily lysophospholipase